MSAVDPVAERMPAAGVTPRLRSLPASLWARAAIAVLALASLVGFVAFPTYPNYDSYYSLLWGRELVHLESLSFEAYRAPT